MAPDLKLSSFEERLNKLAPLAPLALSLHGTTLLLFGGGTVWQWAAVLVVGLLGLWGLSGWRNFKQALLLRATFIFIITWLLLLTTGGVGSFFLLWYFVLLAVYPFLLPPLPALVLLLGVPLSYLLLLPLSPQPLPLIVVLSRVFLLMFIGGLMRLLGSTMARYIAERRQIEEHLRYQAILLQSISEAVITTDLDFMIQSWNGAAETLYGWRAEEIIGKRMSKVIPTSYPTLQPEAVAAGFQAEGLWQGEVIQQHKEGHTIYVLSSVTWVRDEAGQPISALAINRDITKRKQMEQQLSDNEKLLRTIAENFPRAYLSVINPDLTIGFTNGQEFKRHRLNPEMFIGRHIRDVFGVYGQDVLETIITAYRQTFAGQEQSFELFIAGEYQSYMTVPLLNEHGDISQILAVVQNINERKQAEEALRESETRFRATFEQAAVGLAHVRPDGRWLRVNQKLCEIVGYPQEELFERTFQDITHPDDLDTDLEKMRQILAGQIQTYSLEKRYLRQDRSIVWITLTVSLVRQSSGEPDYFISVVQDITQRKNLEEQYHQAQKMEAIGQLTAGIAHDFNNLLTAINGFAGLMQLELSPDDPHQDSLAKILHSGQRAAELVRQLLAFSRKQVIQPRIINLNTAVAEIDKMLRRIIGENIKLEIRLAPDLGEVKVDPTQLEQVIVNLAVNARDAMPAGGRLIIETSNVLLADQYLSHRLDTQSGEHVLLAISDTGHGMSEEVKAHIFEPFFTTKEQGKGTGLGLATVYGIIKQNGGQIWVYSEPGLGTTFKIYLPCVNVRLYG